MKCNRLQLNSSKSEFIWCLSLCRVEKPYCNPFVIGTDAVQPKNKGCDLVRILDRELSMTSHIMGLVRASFAILRQLRSVSRSLMQNATRHLVESLILSQLITAISPLLACHSAASFGCRQSSTLLLSGTASQNVQPHLNPDARSGSGA